MHTRAGAHMHMHTVTIICLLAKNSIAVSRKECSIHTSTTQPKIEGEFLLLREHTANLFPEETFLARWGVAGASPSSSL